MSLVFILAGFVTDNRTGFLTGNWIHGDTSKPCCYVQNPNDVFVCLM